MSISDLAEIRFLYPWVLLGLVVLPFLAWLLGKQKAIPSITVPSLAGAAALGRAPRRHSGYWRMAFPLLGVALTILAMARPRMPRGDTPDPSKGIDIMLCLDFSRSMAEEDFRLQGKRVSRRRALESVTESFIEGRPNDRIGIVCFARNPFLVSPLTLDHKWALESLKQTDLATGTGIGWALLAGDNYLKKDSDRSRVIILVTDGDNSAGPRGSETVSALIQDRIKLYAVLIGPEMVTPTMAGSHDLNKAARATGGQFFQANDSHALQGIYLLIDKLEKLELVQKRFVLWRELYPGLVWAALGCLVLPLVGDATKRRWP
ncbi:MAG TPA: VWA domain-containing protein [Candidatus Limnocylindria bacterium]|jgi:Ca-activated chloride channel family protein|nr:VWA domain-containing protein [Candidatus Limnocylindria bacterium]